MKAVSALAMVLIASLSVVTVEGVYLFSTVENFSTLKKSIREMSIIGEINKLEILKKHLHQALTYSFYQSRYDISRLGGYSELSEAPKAYNNLPYWRTYSTTYLPNYKQNIESLTLNFFKKYLEKIVTDVQIPTPSNVEITRKDSDFASVKVVNDKLKLTKGNLTIEEKGNVLETIKSNVFKMYDLAKAKFITIDSINQAVLDGIAASGFSSSGSSTTCGSCPNMETVFQTTNGRSISDAKNLIKQKIDEKLTNLQSTDDISLNLEDRTKESDIQTSCSDRWGSCCQSHSECTATDPETGACTSWTTVCDAYYCRKDCSFTYYGAARALVKITDTKVTYPVYDGTTDFRNLKLNFYVLSGNRELITP